MVTVLLTVAITGSVFAVQLLYSALSAVANKAFDEIFSG